MIIKIDFFIQINALLRKTINKGMHPLLCGRLLLTAPLHGLSQ